MSNPEYITGSREFVVVDLTCTTSGFDVTEWTGELTFAALDSPFDPDDADVTWITGVALTPGATSAEFSAAVMQTVDMTLTHGEWTAYARLTNVEPGPGYERPVIEANGTITVV